MTSCEGVPENDDDSFIILRRSPEPGECDDLRQCDDPGQDVDGLLDISPENSVLQRSHAHLTMSARSVDVEEENRVLRECVRRQRDVARDTLRAIDHWRAALTHTATNASMHVNDENEQLREEIKQLKEDVSRLQRSVLSTNEETTPDSVTSETERERVKERERSQIEWVTSPEDDMVDKLGAQLALVEGQRRQLVIEVEQLSWQRECLERVADGVTHDRTQLQGDVTRLQDDVTRLQADLDRRQEEIEQTERLWRNRETEWKKQDMEWKKQEDEWKNREVEWKKQQAEMEKQVTEWKKQAAEWKKQEAECKKQEAKMKKHETEWKKQEAEWKKQEAEWKKQEAEWKKQEAEWKERNIDVINMACDLRKRISDQSENSGVKSAKAQVPDLQTLTHLLLQRLEYMDVSSSAVRENTELGHLRDKLTAIFAGSNDTSVCALSAALVARGEDLEAARGEVARLNDHIQLLQHQLDLYKSDFEAERAAREQMAGRLDRLTAHGEPSAPPPLSSSSAAKDMAYECPLCVNYHTSRYADLEIHLDHCLQD